MWMILLALIVALSPAVSGAAPFFNSAEPGADGSDPNILFSDDFEHNAAGGLPGTWYTLNCDNANAAGGIGSQSKGWCGTIFADPITPAGAVVCGNRGAAGTNCAATSGPKTGIVGGKNMADHNFFGGEVSEFWLRWYRMNDPGYRYSGQKVLSINHQAGSGGIFWGGFGTDCGIGAPMAPNASPGWQMSVNGQSCVAQNLGNNISTLTGRWYAFQVHIKLNTAIGTLNGIGEFYIDDCGTGGFCSGTPTARHRRTNLDWRAGEASGNGATTGIGAVWFENWANSGDVSGNCGPDTPLCGSTGTEYYDQIIASKVGPIPFAGIGTAPPPPPGTPTGLTVTGLGSPFIALFLVLILAAKRKAGRHAR